MKSIRPDRIYRKSNLMLENLSQIFIKKLKTVCLNLPKYLEDHMQGVKYILMHMFIFIVLYLNFTMTHSF